MKKTTETTEDKTLTDLRMCFVAIVATYGSEHITSPMIDFLEKKMDSLEEAMFSAIEKAEANKLDT